MISFGFLVVFGYIAKKRNLPKQEKRIEIQRHEFAKSDLLSKDHVCQTSDKQYSKEVNQRPRDKLIQPNRLHFF